MHCYLCTLTPKPRWLPYGNHARKSDATRARLLAPGCALRGPPCVAALAPCTRQPAQAQFCRARAMLTTAMLELCEDGNNPEGTWCPSLRGEPSHATATARHMVSCLSRAHTTQTCLITCLLDHCSTGYGLVFFMLTPFDRQW